MGLSGPITLLFIDVLAALINISVSSSVILCTKCDWMYFTAYLAAYLYPDIIVVGWTLILINSLARRSNSAAKTTTDVVPSPTSLSYN